MWDSNPRPHSWTRMPIRPSNSVRVVSLESGALDHSANLTTLLNDAKIYYIYVLPDVSAMYPIQIQNLYMNIYQMNYVASILLIHISIPRHKELTPTALVAQLTIPSYNKGKLPRCFETLVCYSIFQVSTVPRLLINYPCDVSVSVIIFWLSFRIILCHKPPISEQKDQVKLKQVVLTLNPQHFPPVV
jgi:hypothetical protein